jgi:autotransporter-associated beta strand protein
VAGFGGGTGGGSDYGGGGGGAGLGADILVQQGGSLVIGTANVDAGTVQGGAGGAGAASNPGQNGSAFGDGIFLQGTETIALAPAASTITTIAGVIADQTGSGGTGGNAGSGALLINGAGTVDLAATNTFVGGLTLTSGTLVLSAAGAAGTGAITFGSSGPPVLAFTIADTPSNMIDGIDNGGTIHVTDLVTKSPSAKADGSGVLSIPYESDGGGTLTLNLAASDAGKLFLFKSDGGSGTDIVEASQSPPPCFRAGTRIMTERGSVAVEALNTDDRVMTVAGVTQPIVWIGHRRVDCVQHAKPHQVWPVRISKGAFGPGTPRRDLWLSPDHAVFVDGVLIPIKYLVNGTTIAQMPCREVTYYHVELRRHDVVYADGMPAESYLDTGDRRNFENGGSVLTLHPDFGAWRWEAEGCAPLIVTGAKLEAVRQRVAAHAAVLHRRRPRSCASRAA